MRLAFIALLVGVCMGSCGSSPRGLDISTPDLVDVEYSELSSSPDVRIPDELVQVDGNSDAKDLAHEDQPGAWDAEQCSADAPQTFTDLGGLCEGGQDCESGLCLASWLGIFKCTRSCADGYCPPLWDCEDFGGEQLCVPAERESCEACDGICASPWNACMELGEGEHVCLTRCFSQADCPGGTICTSGADGDMRCLPESGSCRCGEFLDRAKRSCEISNSFGTCHGLQECLGPAGWSSCDAAIPVQELCDGLDNDCDGDIDEGFPDSDDDGESDCFDEDIDGDLLLNHEDNCPTVFNPIQWDIDDDGLGNLCDDDIDDDGVSNEVDNCIYIYNPEQIDHDDNGLGVACEEWEDYDTIPDTEDNCPFTSNQNQLNTDGDTEGDACDDDDDNDGFADELDCSPRDPVTYPAAAELCDGLDNDCNNQVDDGWPDSNQDGIPNCLDDDDGDQVTNGKDNCPGTFNPNQRDLDGDGMGDECDGDLDGDGVDNEEDNCSIYQNPDQLDLDQDGIGDACLIGTDGDMIPKESDNCPDVPNEGQEDLDQDGIGDVCDDDLDGDTDTNEEDCAPRDPSKFHGAEERCDGLDNDCDGQIDEDLPDLDQDGVSDCYDDDDDGDKIQDSVDNCPRDYNPIQWDMDLDGHGDACDSEWGEG